MRRIAIFLVLVVFPGAFFFLNVGEASAAANCFVYSERIGYVCDPQPVPPVFAQPTPAARNPSTTPVYGRKANNVNVYPRPDAGSAPLYNRGSGFLFVSIQGQVEANGEKWYLINPGEYVRASQVNLTQPSQFQGTLIQRQPTRPFGWIVANVRPSRQPAGPADSDLPLLYRYDFFQVYDAAVAADGWVWYRVGPESWIRQTNVSLVDPSPRPEGVGERDYWVEVDLYEQIFAAYRGDEMVYAGLVSSGLPRFYTREGLFQVWGRYQRAKMSGQNGKPEFYYLQDVPHIMYFDRDIGLHGAYWHNRFGFRASRGCVNMSPADAEWVFRWSARADHPLWVWVHSSNPRHYFEKYP